MSKKRPAPLANARAINRVWEAFGTWTILVCATLFAYGPSLEGGRLWDDAAHLTSPELQSFHGLWRIWFELGATQQYYPLLHSAFWVEHRLWGDAMLGYHLANVVLHATAACVVVMIGKRLSVAGAWLAGLIFALHPECVESVAWISEQKSTLSGVFYLGAALAYLYFDRDRRKRQYFLALGLFVLALLTKTVTATLPAVLLVILWWLRGRLEWRRDVLPLVPWFAIAVPAGLLTAWVERVYIGAQGADFVLTPVQRLLLAGRAPWFYASKLVLPVNLMFSYPRWKLAGEWWEFLFPAGLAAVAMGLVLLARTNRGPLAGFLIFCGGLFPVLGFLNVFPFRYSYVADHFQYLASLGILVPAAAGLAMAAERFRLGRTALPAGLAVVLGVLTWQQSGVYRDEETLYRATLARNPDSFFVHLDLGAVLFTMPGRMPDAIAEFESAVRLNPGSPEAHANLGNALAEVPERVPEAIVEYQAALRLKPDFADAHDNLGNALAALPGRLPEAIAEYEAALRSEPNFAVAHDNLGNALAKVPGRLQEAIAEYQAALRLRPDFAEAHNNLGNAWLQIPGKQQEAIAEFQAALRIKPDMAMIHFNLANTLSEMPGRLEEAVAEYRAAVQIEPGAAEFHHNLAYTLAQMPGHLAEAMAECAATLQIRPDSEPARRLMARLQAAQASGGIPGAPQSTSR